VREDMDESDPRDAAKPASEDRKDSRPPKHSRTNPGPVGSDGESDKEDSERIIAPTSKKRGRPRKPEVVEATHSSESSLVNFNVPV
jgi:hypothetical protein